MLVVAKVMTKWSGEKELKVTKEHLYRMLSSIRDTNQVFSAEDLVLALLEPLEED